MIMKRMPYSRDFTQYLLKTIKEEGSNRRLPNLSEISKELNLSVSIIREQLEAAKVLGFVEARPRIGVRPLPYSFLPAVRESLLYALELDYKYFDQFAKLRNNIEASFWFEAVKCLSEEDHNRLKEIITIAWKKLTSSQIQIPHDEHRMLHLNIFRKLNNPFVTGILEAYWDAYEIAGLNLYTDYDYLREVWQYHEMLVEAICSGDYSAGYQALIKHSELLYHRPVQLNKAISLEDSA
jgi:DNA-binding FadR family transcriptional regulator